MPVATPETRPRRPSGPTGLRRLRTSMRNGWRSSKAGQRRRLRARPASSQFLNQQALYQRLLQLALSGPEDKHKIIMVAWSMVDLRHPLVCRRHPRQCFSHLQHQERRLQSSLQEFNMIWLVNVAGEEEIVNLTVQVLAHDEEVDSEQGQLTPEMKRTSTTIDWV